MKTQELRELSVEELRKKAEELRRQLLTMRVAKTNQQVKNPLQLRFLRRDIARILTILQEKGDK
jgi:large subunit ribosomal protein L29